MSETEDRRFRVAWRSISVLANSNIGEVLADKTFTAAYYLRDGDRVVFKRADGRQVFDIAGHLIETIEYLDEDGPAEHVAASGALVDEARNYQRRNTPNGGLRVTGC